MTRILECLMAILLVAFSGTSVAGSGSRSPRLAGVGFTAVDGGIGHSLALKSDGTVWAWGNNINGQLGDGTQEPRTTPVQVSGISGVLAVASGAYHNLALRSDGTVWAWGLNGAGQLGDGTRSNSRSPVQVTGVAEVVAIAAGGNHSLALTSNGTIWAWGDNQFGQLGDGTTTSRATAVALTEMTAVATIAAGFEFSLAQKNDGTVWAWGHNLYGQLGDGTTTHRYAPVPVGGLSEVTTLGAGSGHSLALMGDGTVWAWGANESGQLGDGNTANRRTPAPVSGLTQIVAVAGGGAYSLALRGDGTSWAWGSNNYGQLGEGTTANRRTPVTVSGFTAGVAIGGGGQHSIASKSDGTVWAWGMNYYGQLGDGTTVDRWTPVQPRMSCTYSIDPSGQSFPAAGGSGSVKVSTVSGCGWTAASNNPAWLAVDSGSPGTGNGTISYRVGANTGVFRTGTITIAGQSFSVYQAPQGGTAPAISGEGLVNAAGGFTGPVAPGEFVSIYGSRLGPAQSVASKSMERGLGYTRVFVNGIEAFLTYSSAGQVNAVMPYSLAGSNRAELQVEYQAMKSSSMFLPVAEAAPGIFTQQYGTGQAWVVNQDQTFNSDKNPAERGSYVAFWATGQGLVNPAGLDGESILAPNFPKPKLPVRVTISDLEAEVLFAGLIYTGVLQANVRIPESVRPGSVELFLTIGTAVSRKGVTLAVR